MKKIIAIFTIFMMISTSMIACEKEEKTTINFLNWGENIADGLIEEFQEKYNIGVNQIFVDDNEEMYQELISGKTQYDVVVPGDYLVERLIAEGRLEKLDKPRVEVQNEKLFFDIIRNAFNMRRKTLWNGVKNIGLSKEKLEEAFDEANIDIKRRGETLSIEEFAALADAIYSRMK